MGIKDNNEQRSLDEINSTIEFNGTQRTSQNFSISRSRLTCSKRLYGSRKLITSMQGGAQFGYTLLFIILISSLSAMLLQSMTVRLGIATDKDLAQMTRHYLNKPTAIIFWIIAELAIIATDIAEVIGSAIALDLLLIYL